MVKYSPNLEEDLNWKGRRSLSLHVLILRGGHCKADCKYLGSWMLYIAQIYKTIVYKGHYKKSLGEFTKCSDGSER